MSGKSFVFQKSIDLPVSAAVAFAWHERAGALQRLIPPWERVELLEAVDGIRDGRRVVLRNRLGPFSFRWVAEHHDYQAGHVFHDTQRSGPFALWEHTHRFEDRGEHASRLTDHIEYRLPGGYLGNLLGARFARGKIARMFDYRHDTTWADLHVHHSFSKVGTMRIAITGANGLVGKTLVPFLTTGGHQVTKITRKNPAPGDIVWDPQSGKFDASALEGFDAVVHLAGENISGARWNDKVKERILRSRVDGTRVLSEGLAKLKTPPKVLLSASAIGYYGDRGDELLDETSAPGIGFLADVCRQWEAAAEPARQAGIRVVHPRFGVILSPQRGALASMLTPFKMFVGGRMGDGKQWWSWIGIDDVAGALHHAIMTESLSGPVNVVAPNPVTNAQFTKDLGTALHRPTIFPMPAFMAKLVLGEMANDLILASARVLPKRLEQTGYTFRHPTLSAALAYLLGGATARAA